jgi:hypothetical protein
VPKLGVRLTVSACDGSPVRVSVNDSTPPSVTGAASAMLTVGIEPTSLSRMVPKALDWVPMT